jgi:hypothetical protein
VTDQIRARLREMIPDLPHPPDRLDAIASRVRRTRRRRAALASALTAVGVLAVAVTTVSVRPAPALKPPPIACPAAPKYRVAGATPQAPGNRAFVQAGSRWAALCIYGGPGGPRPGPPVKYLLHTKVDRLTQVLNRLPPVTQRCVDPGMSYPGPPTVIVLASPDRTTQVVQLNLACGGVANGQAERADLRTTADTFYALYREQVAATINPDSIKPATCVGQLDATHLTLPDGRRGEVYDTPRDDILRDEHDIHWNPAESVLPSPVAAASICRYVAAGGHLLRLDRTWQGRTDLEQLRSEVNQTYQRPNAPGQQTTWCMGPTFESPQITTVDVIWLTDVTGRVLEVRVARKPCSGVEGTIPLPTLTTTLDRLLG